LFWPAAIIYYFIKRKEENVALLYNNSDYAPYQTNLGTTYSPDQTRQNIQTIIKEKEIVRVIVKIPCQNCGYLNENTQSKCEHCAAILKK